MKKEYKYHYTYRITNTEERMYYYGVHSCNCLPKEDIGVKYFSSTKKEFIKDQKENPQNYKYKVLKIFSTRKEAVEHEIFLHNKFNVKCHKQFYNKSNQTSVKFDTTGTKIVHSETRNKKISLALTGVKHPKERVEKMKNSLLKKYEEGYINPNKGKKASQEVRNKISKNHARISGEDNHMTKTIKIFNSKDELKFISTGSFSKLCKEHNLPENQLVISFKNNGSPIYKSNKGKNGAIKIGFGEYIGWYATIDI